MRRVQIAFAIALSLPVVAVAKATDPVAGKSSSNVPPAHPPAMTRPRPDPYRFDRLDIDSDGQLSKGEAGGDIGLIQQFAKYDRDGDGRISAAEYDGYRNGTAKD